MSVFGLPLALGRDEVHVWIARTDDFTEEALARCAAHLSPDERAQAEGLLLVDHRARYTIARALVRTTLSRYTPVAPKDWRFTRNEHGRPEPAMDVAAPRFNLSDTTGLVALAVGWERPIGLDVEDLRRSGGGLEIARRFFAPSEHAALAALPADKQRAHFFAYWTLKEAYVKALGLGLSAGLSTFAFELSPEEDPRIRFLVPTEERPSDWQFNRFTVGHHHLLALAARRGEAPALALKAFELSPSGTYTPRPLSPA